MEIFQQKKKLAINKQLFVSEWTEVSYFNVTCRQYDTGTILLHNAIIAITIHYKHLDVPRLKHGLHYFDHYNITSIPSFIQSYKNLSGTSSVYSR